MSKTAYWDNDLKQMVLRDCTPEEEAEIDMRRAAGPSLEIVNAPILNALEVIDGKTSRAVREAIKTGDNSRVLALENEAVALRAKLVKG